MGALGVSVNRQVQLAVGIGEALVPACVPLHGSPGTGAAVGALLGPQQTLGQSQLVAEVQEGCTGHGVDPGVGEPQLVVRQTGGGAKHIMVAGDEAVQPQIPGVLVLGQVIGQEAADIGAGVLGEVAAVGTDDLAVGRFVKVAHHSGVAVAPPLLEEVHVEAGLGELGVDGYQDLLTDVDGALLVGAVQLDKGVGHVHTEAGGTLLKPEADHIGHSLAGLDGIGAVHTLLPGIFRFVEAIIQGGLGLEVVEHIAAVAVSLACDEGQWLCALKDGGDPDIAAGVFVFSMSLDCWNQACSSLRSGDRSHKIQHFSARKRP